MRFIARLLIARVNQLQFHGDLTAISVRFYSAIPMQFPWNVIILNSGFVWVHAHTPSKQRWRDCVFVVTLCCKSLYLQSDGLEFEVETFFEVELSVLFTRTFFFSTNLPLRVVRQSRFLVKSPINRIKLRASSRRQIAVKSPSNRRQISAGLHGRFGIAAMNCIKNSNFNS